jgi:hypothetical protein
MWKRTISKEKTLPSTGMIRGDAGMTHTIPTKNFQFQSPVVFKDSSHLQETADEEQIEPQN